MAASGETCDAGAFALRLRGIRHPFWTVGLLMQKVRPGGAINATGPFTLDRDVDRD